MFESQFIPHFPAQQVESGRDGMFDSVLGVYEQHGYEAGYRQAVLDVGLGLLGLTEDLIVRSGLGGSAATDLRRAVLALQDNLQRSTARSALGDTATVEGGLGI